MSKPLSQQIGNLLYRHFFPVYNVIYPIFKNKQDADEIAYLKKIIKPGDTVLDIGANIGFYSKILANCTGASGKVHAFEPDKTNFKYLKGNTAKLNNVILNNKAVSEKTEELKIYKSKDLNVDHRTYPVGEYESIETIDAVSIDDYIDGKFRVQVVKMDIQGFEVSALKGMQKTVTSNPKIVLLLELWPYGLHAAGSTVQQFYEVVSSMGLTIYFLEKDELSELKESDISHYETWGLGQYKNIVLCKI